MGIMSLLSAVFGFVGPFLPELLKYFKAKQDHKFEMDRMRLSAEIAEKQATWRMRELEVHADIAEQQSVHQPAPSFGVRVIDAANGLGWKAWAIAPVVYLFAILDFLSNMVRPAITYAVISFYLAFRWAQFSAIRSVSSNDVAWHQIVQGMWTEFDQSLLMLVLSYWFGTRAAKYAFSKA